MKVTKYPQSCLVLEKDGKRLLIDPGSMFTAEYSREHLDKIDAVLITHQHGDHFDQPFVGELIKEGVPVFGNQEVSSKLDGIKVAEDGQPFEVAGFGVLPHDLPHCRMPEAYGVVQNTGYIIDGNFFHAGDGVETQGVRVHDAAVPVAGPDISFYDAKELVKGIQAKRVVPIHYHEQAYPANMKTLEVYMEEAGAELVALKNGESAEF